MRNVANDIVVDVPLKQDNFLTEVLMGLSKSQKSIHPKYLYDKKGSELFEEITRLPEYYPTRAERLILSANAEEIAGFIGEGSLVIEPGSGAGEKIRLLLPHLKPSGYVPIEISREILIRMTDELLESHPGLNVTPVCADFSKCIDLPVTVDSFKGKKVIFFPGSTIGNFHCDEARELLKNFSKTVGKGGGLLIGVDLKKEISVIEKAYNDKAGVTAAFNLNLLERLNREVGANFNVRNFEHVAIYNQHEGRIEMHLKSRVPQLVRVNQTIFRFREGETIHTECSYKYTIEEFCEVAAKARFIIRKTWMDPEKLFCLYYFERD